MLRIEPLGDFHRGPPAAAGRLGRRAACTTLGCFGELGNKARLAERLTAAGVERLAPRTRVLRWDDDAVLAAVAGAAVGGEEGARGEEGEGVLVLKPASGCGGNGIRFVPSLSGALAVVREQARLLRSSRGGDSARGGGGGGGGLAGGLADAERGRFDFVAQALVASRLVRGGRKLHLRAYLLATPAPGGGGESGESGAFYCYF